MHRRQPLPRLWLMTDERQGEALWTALEQLPRGSGIVFRHYGLGREQRTALFQRVKKIARRRGLMLILSDFPSQRADGRHGKRRRARDMGIRTASVHGLREIRAAERAGADLLFLSPIFATRSHPGARTMGRSRFALLTRQARLPVIALGGMTARRARGLAGAYGWAGIDAWS